jgi:hypothetical protein
LGNLIRQVGCGRPGPRVLVRCARGARAEWPSPQRLLRAALILDPSEALRAELHALLEARESEGRRRVFSNPREETLVAAVLQVTRQQRKTLAWVTGHGEGDPGSNERNRGYATARTFLEQEYYEVLPVSLLDDEVPVGTAALLVIGPQKDFLPEELAALDRYLQRPGNVLLDPQRAPGWHFLGQYRVSRRMTSWSIPLPGSTAASIHHAGRPDRRAHHRRAARGSAAILLDASRRARRGAARDVVTVLPSTGPESWATSDLTAPDRRRLLRSGRASAADAVGAGSVHGAGAGRG